MLNLCMQTIDSCADTSQGSSSAIVSSINRIVIRSGDENETGDEGPLRAGESATIIADGT